MPSSYESLREKFMKDGSDGIKEAETLLTEAGAKFLGNGMIDMPINWNLEKHTQGEIVDAIDFLVGEWDYVTRFDPSAIPQGNLG